VQQDPKPLTPTMIYIVKDPPAKQLSMIDVSIAAFGLTGVIMVAALVAGLCAGIAYTWYRSRRPITMIEAQGGKHNLFS
jgi:NADH:ubiquinone oxidoreductase subunit 3 (subunit A)